MVALTLAVAPVETLDTSTSDQSVKPVQEKSTWSVSELSLCVLRRPLETSKNLGGIREVPVGWE